MRFGVNLPKYKFLLALGDYVAIILGFVVAVKLNLSSRWIYERHSFWGSFSVYSLFGVVWGFILQSQDLYKLHVVTSRVKQSVLLLKGSVYGVICFSVIAFLIRPPFFLDSRLMVFSIFAMAVFFLFIWRFLIWKLIWNPGLGRGIRVRRVAIIGTGSGALGVAMSLAQSKKHGMQVVGYVDDQLAKGSKLGDGHLVLGNTHELEQLTYEHHVDSFILAPESVTIGDVLEIAERCTRMGRQVDIVSDLCKIVIEKWSVERYTDIPVVRLVGAHHSYAVRIVKRIFDIVIALVLIVLLLPVFLMFCALIKLESRGPIIYKQKRVGQDGNIFSFYKLRTMTVGGEVEDVQTRSEAYRAFIDGTRQAEKIINPSRVTYTGRFLRKTSLDELPQIFNVLKGNMSLVGPRPCLPYEYAHYKEWQKKRLLVKPGCTGLWQISDRLKMSFDEMVLLDLYYVGNVSLWLDLGILLKTVPVVIFGKGGK